MGLQRDYLEHIRKKYPQESIEKHIQWIEKMGYTVCMNTYGFQIWDGESLLIDSDVYENDYYLNAILGIDAFYE